MPYATQADMIARFGEREVIAISDRNLTAQVDVAVLAAAIEQAGDVIDAHLGGRYALPLATVPRLLVGVACDIARYQLCGADAQETEPARNRYKDAIRLLEQIKDGHLSLGLDPASQPVATSGTVLIVNGRRTFDRNTLADY